ncbi:hypothetical protein HK097_002514 [Rhizophlyctis rosea]|uniref:Uncharacterized protein n=1 Tax=Rhizophlyctis rosea TaxID=64517 RepID=A0AAD5S5A9_9FUNG|nr:hypothetical protein HK097_002514 [Rhizophlyctis rosea]
MEKNAPTLLKTLRELYSQHYTVRIPIYQIIPHSPSTSHSFDLTPHCTGSIINLGSESYEMAIRSILQEEDLTKQSETEPRVSPPTSSKPPLTGGNIFPNPAEDCIEMWAGDGWARELITKYDVEERLKKVAAANADSVDPLIAGQEIWSTTAEMGDGVDPAVAAQDIWNKTAELGHSVDPTVAGEIWAKTAETGKQVSGDGREQKPEHSEFDQQYFGDLLKEKGDYETMKKRWAGCMIRPI